MKVPIHLNAKDLHELLKAKFAPPTYAYFPEVKASVGFSNRTADGIAVAMWRSHGLAVHGFEIKCYRGDWRRELKQPEKSDAVFRYCDYWWVVASDSSVVRPEELPENWGLQVAAPDGKSLKLIVKAPKLKPVPLAHEFVCEILRSCYGEKKTPFNDDYYRGVKEGEKVGQGTISDLKSVIAAFQEHSGIKLDQMFPERAANIGDIVKQVLDGEHQQVRGRLEYMLRQTEDIVKDLKKSLAKPEQVNENS